MLVDPLPVNIPFDWTILQKDHHRYSAPMTPGITGIQSYNTWLSQLVKTVRFLVRVMFRTGWEVIVPSLSIVNWIRRRLVLIDRIQSIFIDKRASHQICGAFCV